MPLKGIKVLELAGLAPGPFCGMVLADFGASVIRVDKVISSAGTQDFLGNGKRSIAINLKTEGGAQVFKKLSNECDVLIDPFRKGVMEKMQLGPDDLMRTNNRLVYARLTGFGQNGPFAKMAGHDINYVAMSGLLSLFGRFGQKPTPPSNLAADFGGGGLMCAFGIILALFERTKSDAGQVIDAAMVDGTAYLGSWLFRSRATDALWSNSRGKNMYRLKYVNSINYTKLSVTYKNYLRSLDSGAHFYDTYETKDKQYMSVGALEPQFYDVLLEKLGKSHDDIPQFGDFEENRAKLEEIFKEKTQEEWCKIFDGTDACVTPVLNVNDVANHAHNKERNTFAIIKNGLVSPNPAPNLSRTPGQSKAVKKQPEPGEHTVEILRELNYKLDEIKNLISSKMVAESRRNSSKL